MFGMYIIAASDPALQTRALVANPIRQVNAQGNATNVTGVGVVKITTIDTDKYLIKALKTKFPKLAVTYRSGGQRSHRWTKRLERSKRNCQDDNSSKSYALI